MRPHNEGFCETKIFFILFLCFFSCRLLSQENQLVKKLDRSVVLQVAYSNLMYESTEIVGLAYHVSVGFHISPKVSVHGGYLSMIDGQGATVLSGLDASSRLFLFSNGSTIDVEGDGKRIVQSSLFTHYLLIGYKLRELAAEETKPQYSGFNFGYGCNWYLGRSFKWNYAKDFFVNPEFDSGNLKSPTGNSSRNSNFSLGFGTLF